MPDMGIPPDLLAMAAADFMADLIQHYDITIGYQEVALKYRPTGEIVQSFPDMSKIPLDLILLALSAHHMRLMEES